MQSCWQPIKRLLSTHIPRHVPSGSIFSGLLPQHGCHEKRHMQNNLSLGRNWQTLCALERTSIARLLRHTAPLPEYWGGEFIADARCHGLLKAKWMAEISNISWRSPMRGHRRLVYYLQLHAESQRPERQKLYRRKS